MEDMKVYNAKDGKKAVDISDLNAWIDARIEGSNPLLLNVSELPDSIKEYRGLVAWGIIVELNEFLKKRLGLISEPEVIESKPDEIEVREAPRQVKTVPRPQPKAPAPAPEPIEDESIDEDRITLTDE